MVCMITIPMVKRKSINMTYTEKMHKSARRQTEGKKNIVTDLLDEIERLQKEVKFWKERALKFGRDLSKDLVE